MPAQDIREKLNLEDIERFGKKHGTNITSRLLSSLGKNQQFIQAWESPVGKEILGIVIPLVEEKLDKIIAETAEDTDKADYRAYMRVLTVFRDKINTYYRNLDKLKEG